MPIRTMADPLALSTLAINPNPPKTSKNHKKQTKQPQKPQTHQKQPVPAEADSEESSQHWSQEIIQPAIKTMSFRKRRGTRMKELMKGKRRKDMYQQQYQNYFGGDLNQSDDSDQEDYQASSSGRDQFDSDFDLTDSYVGKRGRKKGSKVNKRKKGIAKGQKAHDSKGRFTKKGRGAQKKEEKEEEGSQEKSDKVEVEGSVQAKTAKTANRSHKKKMQIQSESIINEPQDISSLSSKSASKHVKASTVPIPSPNPSPIQDIKLI